LDRNLNHLSWDIGNDRHGIAPSPAASDGAMVGPRTFSRVAIRASSACFPGSHR
jgi:hypothetical protein